MEILDELNALTQKLQKESIRRSGQDRDDINYLRSILDED
jgi:hypothetical protein